MRKIIYILLFTSLICSCFNAKNKDSNSTKNHEEIESEITHEYNEINDKKITWNSIFSLAKTQYFVYFFSKNCSHCNQIKNDIISYALTDENFYFVEDSKDTVLLDDVSQTIGLNSIDHFGILGFPSLVKIENNFCVLNIAGAHNIYLSLSL